MNGKRMDSVEIWSGGNYSKVNPEFWCKITSKKISLATFGAGCFWGTEKFFAKDFALLYPKSIIGTSVGFMHTDPTKTD